MFKLVQHTPGIVLEVGEGKAYSAMFICLGRFGSQLSLFLFVQLKKFLSIF